jgi:hypothetical protein
MEVNVFLALFLRIKVATIFETAKSQLKKAPRQVQLENATLGRKKFRFGACPPGNTGLARLRHYLIPKLFITSKIGNILLSMDRTIKSIGNILLSMDRTVKSIENMVLSIDRTIKSIGNIFLSTDRTVKSIGTQLLSIDIFALSTVEAAKLPARVINQI